VLYEGPSRLNGSPVVAIATGLANPSQNSKTGDELQVWILVQDDHPIAALQDGGDAAICGDCKHRPYLGGSCYVNVGQAPGNIWKSYKRGIYPKVTEEQVKEIFAGTVLRFGAYGDPAAVPLKVWQTIFGVARGWTGYTHQWRTLDASWQGIMASVDNIDEYIIAKEAGWRTFRVRKPQEDLLAKEISCPAAVESTKTYGTVVCADCRLCDGTAKSPKIKDIAIVVHGSKSKRFIEAGA